MWDGVGIVRDQAELQGLLQQLSSLGTLLEVTAIDEAGQPVGPGEQVPVGLAPGPRQETGTWTPVSRGPTDEHCGGAPGVERRFQPQPAFTAPLSEP